MKNKPLFLTLFSILLACLPLGLAAVNGHITTNTTWDVDTIVTGDLWVDENVTLTINPGVTVWFPMVDQNAYTIGDTDFIVNGRLICNGTPEQKVRFVSLETEPGIQDWAGITLAAGSTQSQSSLNNVEIYNAYRGILINGVGPQATGVKIFNGSDYGVRVQSTTSLTRFTNCQIEEINSNGMTIESGSVTFTDVSISHNGGYGLKALNPVTISATRLNIVQNGSHGLWLENTQTAGFTDCRFNSNTDNGVRIDRMSPTFNNCQINNNQQYGVYIFGNAGTPEFSNCTISSNTFGLYFNARPATVSCSNIEYNALGIGVNRTNPTINNCNITNNGSGVNDITYNFTSESDWRTTGGAVAIPQSILVPFPIHVTSMTYKKDGDNYSYSYNYTYMNYTRVIANQQNYLVNEYSRFVSGGGSHNMPEITVTGSINQAVLTRDQLKLDLYNRDHCSSPRAWATQIKYRVNYFCAIENLSGTIANLQNNWWGQITGVDSLVAQSIPGTANYEGAMVSRITNAGCNLPNIAPSIALTAPTSLEINPASTQIAWIGRDFDDDAEISLYYNSSQSTDGALIASGLSEDSVSSYTWDFANTPYGKYYIYAKIDDGTNPPVYSFAPGQVMVGPLTVKIEDCYAAAGDTIIVPVIAYNAYDDFDLNAFQITIGYTHTLLSYLDTVTPGTLIEDWTVNSNGGVTGQVSVNGYSTECLNGSGDLFLLRFVVADGATDLQNTNLTISNFQYNNGSPEPVIESGTFQVRNRYDMDGWSLYYSNNNPVPGVEITAGGFAAGSTISDADGYFNFPDFHYGEYTLDPSFTGTLPELLISPLDASMIARYALGLISFDASQVTAGNVDADGDVDIYDAALIARYCVGLLDELPAGVMKFTPQSHSFLLSPAYTARTFTGIAVGDVSGNWRHTRPDPITTNVTFNIWEDESQAYLQVFYPQQFYSLFSKIAYNQSNLAYAGYIYDGACEDLDTTVNDHEGILALAAFGTTLCQGNPGVITFMFDKTGTFGEGDLEALYLVFDESLGSPTSGDDLVNPVPTSLYQNYPNPFNPVTNISFSLASAQNVKLVIYNLKGQKVHTLVDGPMPSGIHRVPWQAEKLASGVYFARLETAEGYKKTMKMILMK